MRQRDDFSASVKRMIAMRVNSRCSNPICSATTSGPAADADKAVNIGVAAHITAASTGGPRYNTNISHEERKGAVNAIWLCQNCAKLVDNDPLRFTENLLRNWKECAELYAQAILGKSSPFDRDVAPAFSSKQGVVQYFDGIAHHDAKYQFKNQGYIDVLPQQYLNSAQMKILAHGRGVLGQEYIVIGAGNKDGWDWDVVFLAGGEFGWEVVMQTQLQSQKGWTPEVFYVPGSPGALALTHVVTYGTGLFQRSTSWYRIARGSPTPLLSYPNRFHLVGWGEPIERWLTSRLVRVPSAMSSGEVLELVFQARYAMSEAFMGSGERGLFSVTEELTLEWNEATGSFIPHTANDDFTKIESIWLESTEGFVRRNSSRLQRLMRNGTEHQRQFVQQHLTEELAKRENIAGVGQ